MSRFMKYINEAIAAYQQKRFCDAKVFLLNASEELEKEIKAMKKGGD